MQRSKRMSSARRLYLQTKLGFRLMEEEGELWKTTRIVLLGNLARWVYLWSVNQIDTTILASQGVSIPTFNLGEIFLQDILPRLLISVIISPLVVAATWRWLRRTFSPAHLKWVAFSVGFYAEPTTGWLVKLLRLLITGAWPA